MRLDKQSLRPLVSASSTNENGPWAWRRATGKPLLLYQSGGFALGIHGGCWTCWSI